jgi:DNA-binding LacI/PurR family transcriptional regulator
VVDGGDGEPGHRLDLGVVRGLELACRYLIEEGHRRIGVLGASATLTAGTLFPRINDAGVSLRDIPADTPKRVAVTLRHALHGPDSPTALVCTSDTIALAAVRYCAVEGMRVPEDLSVIGFGDSPVARHSYPALSSIRVSLEAMAVSCANAMFELLSGNAFARVAPAMRLVIRESSGAKVVSREA